MPELGGKAPINISYQYQLLNCYSILVLEKEKLEILFTTSLLFQFFSLILLNKRDIKTQFISILDHGWR